MTALITIRLTTLTLILSSLLISCSPAAVTMREKVTEPGKDWWSPQPGQSWQIQYEGDIDLDVDAEIYNLDLFETTPEMIETLHAKDKKVVCYLNAGAWEDWRPDSKDFPEEMLGKKYEGWPGERWIDIRQIDLLAAPITARLDLCAQKGFDGVDPDNVDGYTNDTGFPISAEDQLSYNRWLAAQAHARNLGIGLKNDPDQAETLAPYFDWITTESCFQEDWCQQVTAFFEAGKPIIAVEYTSNPAQINAICQHALANQVEIIFKHRQLDAWRKICP